MSPSGHPRVTITPHIAAITLPQQAMDQIVANIRALEAGYAPAGVVDSGVTVDPSAAVR
ncbi:hypothetical protein [Serratia marcescens]|uniref:hypothetical protein n=1 Tax=Serratia marcescens TaxID=615 RepID=UPI00339CE8DB